MNSIVDEFEMEIGLVTSEESSLLPHLSNPSHDPCHEILFAEFAVGYDYMLPGWHYLCINEGIFRGLEPCHSLHLSCFNSKKLPKPIMRYYEEP